MEPPNKGLSLLEQTFYPLLGGCPLMGGSLKIVISKTYNYVWSVWTLFLVQEAKELELQRHKELGAHA